MLNTNLNSRFYERFFLIEIKNKKNVLCFFFFFEIPYIQAFLDERKERMRIKDRKFEYQIKANGAKDNKNQDQTIQSNH